MSNCKIFRNKDKSINKVMDEFGNESQLYQDTLFHVSTLVDNIPLTPPIKHYLDKGDIMDTSVSEVALGLWAYSYSKHFRDKYNITKSNLEEVSVDDIIRHIEEYYPKPVTATPTVVQQEVKEENIEKWNRKQSLISEAISYLDKKVLNVIQNSKKDDKVIIGTYIFKKDKDGLWHSFDDVDDDIAITNEELTDLYLDIEFGKQKKDLNWGLFFEQLGDNINIIGKKIEIDETLKNYINEIIKLKDVKQPSIIVKNPFSYSKVQKPVYYGDDYKSKEGRVNLHIGTDLYQLHESSTFSGNYKNIKRVFIDIQNPLILPNEWKDGILSQSTNEQLQKMMDNGGYDGIIAKYPELKEGNVTMASSNDIYIVRNQNQIIDIDWLQEEGIKEGVAELFESNPELASQIYEAVGFNNLITPNDKIVFGHPTIGKSFLKDKGEDKFISLDDDYGTKINNEVGEIAKTYKVTTYQVKDGGNQEWNKDYNTMMQGIFEIAKQKAISENKTLFTSNTNLLKTNIDSFDKVINISDEEFYKRIKERQSRGGAKYDTKEWKSQINDVISKIPANKVINTNKYLSDLFITPQQKQQAQQLYSQYLDQIFPNSKVKDIVYHFSTTKIEKPNKEKFSLSANINRRKGFFGINKNVNPGINFANIEGTISHAMLFDMKNPDFGDFSIVPPVTAKDETKDSAIIKQRGNINYYAVFEPEQIHILGNKKDIQGFKDFVSGNVIPEQRVTDEMLNSIQSINATENTIRDLAARMADRIGMSVKFESDRTKDYKGKIENNTAVINLANATLDTPIHEILGHPIIRAIKNGITKSAESQEEYDKLYKKGYYDPAEINPEYAKLDDKGFPLLVKKNLYYLYQNLLKELETGKGKEVLDRIKKDYVIKEFNIIEFEKWLKVKNNGRFFNTRKDYASDELYQKVYAKKIEEYIKETGKTYTLEEQQEEAIVELLGLYTANRLDSVKDGKLISLLKRLLKEIKSFIRQLLNQKEIEIDKLPDNMTIGDLANLLAYSNSKLILPGNEVIYTTPDNQQFKTYAEASNYISDLAKSVEDVDLDNINIQQYQKIIDPINNKEIKRVYSEWVSEPGLNNQIYTIEYVDGSEENKIDESLTKEQIKFYDNIQFNTISPIKNFIERNKEYEQSKEIIEEWKKVNDIVYNPEEVYSRGQEFVSVVGAYSDFDVNLMMQNLLQHIEDNKKAGGEFTISAFTKPIDRTIGHLESGGGKIKFKIYPQSKDIKWASNIDVFSGSVWDASEKVNKDKKSELLGVSYTKYPALRIISSNTIQPNLSSIIDNLAHHHNELGISLTGNNFRLEYDDDIPYSTKKIINGINKILDQKYGKLVKPEIKKTKLVTKYIVASVDPADNVRYKTFENEKDAIDYKEYLETNNPYLDSDIIIDKLPLGIQPTQTEDTLVESIESVKDKVTNEYKLTLEPITKEQYDNAVEESFAKSNDVIGDWTADGEIYYVDVTDTLRYRKDSTGYYAEKADKISKEYTDQALINTKIAKLKEVAKKYPRSLIRSEVKPINTSQYTSLFNETDDLPFQKVPTYNPETKSKTELLDEFNKLVEVSEKMGTKYPKDAINKIKSFLQDLNFNLSTVDEILSRRGLSDNPKAVIDFAYNLVAFGDGATVEDFAEEIGHIISLHAPQDRNLDRALEAIKDTQLYKDNYLNYVKTYSKPGLALEMTPERKAALEVLGQFYGKLLTGTLTEKDMKVSKQSFFTRIMNFVKRMINRTDNFNLRTYLEHNRDNFFLEPGKEIKSKEIFYSLEQSENIAYNKMFNAIDNMIGSMKSRMAREINDTSAPLGEYSKRQANLQTQLALLYQMKENIAYDSAIAEFLKSLYVDSANIFSFLEKYFVVRKEKKEITLNDIKFNKEEKIFVGDAIIDNTTNTLTFDMFKLGRLKKDADLSTLHYSQLSELREFLMHYNSFVEELGIANLSNNLLTDSQLDDLSELFDYVNTSLNSIETALNVLNKKKMPDAIDTLIEETGVDAANIPKDILDALKDTNITGDVGMMEYLLGTTRDSSQPILRLFNSIIKNIMHIAKRNTLSFAGKFLDKLNHRIGQSMDWAYEKYNGKFTGYLISEYNYGRFKEEKDKFFKDLNLKYEYPVDANAKEVMFNSIVTRFNNNDVAKAELKALKVKLNKELDANKRTQYEEQIDTLNTLIDNVEKDHNKLSAYRNEINRWYKENTTELADAEQIIQSVIDDPELSSTEKIVWYNNNVTTNDSGDVIGYKNELVRPSNKYINPDYAKLSSTDLQDLNYIKETKKELDKFLPTKINRLAPQTYQSAMDTFMKTQLPELRDKLKFLGKDVVSKKEDDEIGELTGDKVSYEDETRIIKYNPTRYTKLLVEPNNISTDLLSSMIAYAKMVSEFKEKAERIEQIEFIAQNIKNGYTVNTDTNISSPSNTSNLVKQLENYLRVQIMGITYPDVTIPVLNIKPTKLLKNFARFVSLKNLGLNFVTQFVDFTTSKLWYHIETTMGDTVTRKSSKLGYSKFTELAQDSIKESASTIKNNKLSAILRTLGLSDNLHSVFNDLDKNILTRDISNKVLFAGYRASNFLVSGQAALAGMYNFRLYNNKWYTEREFNKIENPTQQFDSLPSAYDNMRVENGLMSIDGMDTKTFNLFTRRMNNLISKIDGKLGEEDKTYAHSTLLGIVTLIHRDWILDGISRRLKKRGFNFDTNAVDEGYWITTARFMRDFFASKDKIKNIKFLVDSYNELDDVQKEGVRRTMRELMVVVGSIALAIIMNLGDDDDDDRDLDYLKDMAAYIATRSTVELTAFYNPFEYLYAATDVFVVGRDLKRIMTFTEMFDAREIESGKWEGWTRSQKYFLQNIPGVNGSLSIANPEASNRYIINNVLGFAGGLDKLKYYDIPLIGSIDEVELKEIEREKR